MFLFFSLPINAERMESSFGEFAELRWTGGLTFGSLSHDEPGHEPGIDRQKAQGRQCNAKDNEAGNFRFLHHFGCLHIGTYRTKRMKMKRTKKTTKYVSKIIKTRTKEIQLKVLNKVSNKYNKQVCLSEKNL